MSCAGVAATDLVRSLTAQSDCHAEALARSGFGALAGQDGLAAGLLFSLLGLYVAFQGWRLLLGRPLHLGDWSVALVKIGFVIVLVTQWPVYERAVHDVVLRGPEEVAGALVAGYRADVGARGDLLASLQRASDTLLDAASAVGGAPSTAAAPGQPPSAAGAQGDGPGGVLRSAALVLLLSTLSPIVGAKLILGFLLAVGPLVLLAALFEASRGLVGGWIRALVAAALALAFANVLLAIQMPMLGPVLARIASQRARGLVETGEAYVALLLVLLFAVVVLAGVLCLVLMAKGFQLPPIRQRMLVPTEAPSPAPQTIPDARQLDRADRHQPSHVAQAALDRRDERLTTTSQGPLATRRESRSAASQVAAASVQLNVQGRRGAVRRSAIASRRDR